MEISNVWGKAKEQISEEFIDIENNMSKKVESRAQVVYGTYVGTGTFGADNPNTLTADFDIKMAIVYGNGHYFITAKGLTTSLLKQLATDDAITISLSDNILEWYISYSGTYDRSPTQLNENGTTYHYILIG